MEFTGHSRAEQSLNVVAPKRVIMTSTVLGKCLSVIGQPLGGGGGGGGGKQESGTFELLLASLRSTITVHAQVSRQSAEHCLFIKLCLRRIHQADMHSGPKCRKTLSYFSAESAHAFLYDAGNCFHAALCKSSRRRIRCAACPGTHKGTFVMHSFREYASLGHAESDAEWHAQTSIPRAPEIVLICMQGKAASFCDSLVGEHICFHSTRQHPQVRGYGLQMYANK